MVEERKGGLERRRMMAKPRPERQHGCRDVFSGAQFVKSMPAALDRHEDSERHLQFLRELYDEPQGGEGPARQGIRRDVGSCSDRNKSQTPRGRQFACSVPAVLEREDSERQFPQFPRSPRKGPRERRPKNGTAEQAPTEGQNVCDDNDNSQIQARQQKAYASLLEWRTEDMAGEEAPAGEENAREIERNNTSSPDIDAPPSPPKKNKIDGAHRSYQGVDEFEDQASRPRRSSGRGSLPSHQEGEIDEDEDREVGEARGTIGSDSFRADMRHFGCRAPYRPQREADFVPCRDLMETSVLRIREQNPFDVSEMTPRRSSGWGSLSGHEESETEEDDEHEDGEARGSLGNASFRVDMRHFGCGRPYRPQREEEEEDELAVICRKFAEMQRREEEEEDEVDFVPCRELTANSVLRVLERNRDVSEMTMDAFQGGSLSRGAF